MSVYVAKCLAKYGAIAFTFAETPSYLMPLTMTPSLTEYSYALNNLTSVETAVLLLATMPRDGMSTTTHMMTSYGVWAHPSRHLLHGVDPSQWPPSLLADDAQQVETKTVYCSRHKKHRRSKFMTKTATGEFVCVAPNECF